MLQAEQMRKELKEANETGKYYLYGKEKRLNHMEYKELERTYMNMKNYISDNATHTLE